MDQSNTQIKVRKMVEQDVPTVHYIDKQLSGSKRVRTWPFSFDVFWNIYHPELSFVAELDGKVVGFVVGTIEKEERSQSIFSLGSQLGSTGLYRQSAWIDMIGIYPEHQGKGIGRALINAFYNECKPKKVSLRWIVRDDDEVLKKVLSSFGFEKSVISTYEKK
jgi:ribosomal protein S18 acetylase RimI-like enzyme